MGVKPLYDRVVVRRLTAETQTAAGIVIPDSASEKPNRGEVIAVGEGALTEQGQLRALAVKPGDHILFSQYAGTEIKIDQEPVLIMRESDILAVIELSETKEKAA